MHSPTFNIHKAFTTGILLKPQFSCFFISSYTTAEATTGRCKYHIMHTLQANGKHCSYVRTKYKVNELCVAPDYGLVQFAVTNLALLTLGGDLAPVLGLGFRALAPVSDFVVHHFSKASTTHLFYYFASLCIISYRRSDCVTSDARASQLAGRSSRTFFER